MKDAFKKIKQLLPFCDVKVEFGTAGVITKFVKITPNYGFLLSDCGGKYNANNFDEKIVKITPIPRIVPEIKGLVDIIDCEELREVADKNNWHKGKIEMIGQKRLEISQYHSGGSGNNYNIRNKNDDDWWTFPAWAVIPHIESEEVEELTMSEVCKELGRTIKIKK